MPLQAIRHPARLVPLAFLVAIAIGTALLMLPAARSDGIGAPFMTALFTATSAVCVTGLIVVDTSTYWSAFGQGTILALFQAGGFGVMAGATLLSLLVFDRLRLSTRVLAQAETRTPGLGDVRGVVRLILVVTIAMEAAVALALAARLHFGYGEPLATAAWNGVFHAVSAFNNAGFSTYTDSVMGFATDPLVLAPLMLAVIVGGLGFPVLYELRRTPRGWRRWSIHTRITLIGSLALIVLGTATTLAFEAGNARTLGAFDAGGRLLGALFHSVVARTAGFNALDVGQLRPETLLVTDLLMFIGGGSAGTAGGIKITTFFLLGFVVWAEVRGSRDTVAFRRRIPHEAQRQALTIVLLACAVLTLATLALLAMSALPLDAVLFEAISAFATVGLSTGITAQLPPAGWAVLIALMFLGRVGTITVATALALRGRPHHYRYPEERPIVG